MAWEKDTLLLGHLTGRGLCPILSYAYSFSIWTQGDFRDLPPVL